MQSTMMTPYQPRFSAAMFENNPSAKKTLIMLTPKTPDDFYEALKALGAPVPPSDRIVFNTTAVQSNPFIEGLSQMLALIPPSVQLSEPDVRGLFKTIVNNVFKQLEKEPIDLDQKRQFKEQAQDFIDLVEDPGSSVFLEETNEMLGSRPLITISRNGAYNPEPKDKPAETSLETARKEFPIYL